MSALSSPSVAAARAPQKLRDSCDACASSKVRCDKAKPTCSRCAKRSTTCQYVATRRGGRRQNSSRKASTTSPNSRSNSAGSSQTINVAATQAPAQSLPPLHVDADVDVFMSNTSDSNYSVFSSLPNTNTNSSAHTPSPRPSTSTTATTALPVWDLFPDFFSTDPTTELYPVPDIYEDFHDLFSTTSVDLSATANPDGHGIIHGADSLFRHHGFGGLDGAVIMEQMKPPEQNMAHRVSPPPGNDDPQPSTCPRSCIIEALGLMRQLLPDNLLTACTAQTQNKQHGQDTYGQVSEAASSMPPTIEAVFAQNEAVIGASIKMLKCTCSEDGYLLAVISLVVFKVLGWYAAAARWKPETTEPSSNASCYGNASTGMADESYSSLESDDFHSARMAVQLVLSKMHRVQHLVNQLSTKLKLKAKAAARRFEVGGWPPNTPPNSEPSMEITGKDPTGALPFSGIMLDQLEVDLRKRLRALSSEIVEVLRRE